MFEGLSNSAHNKIEKKNIQLEEAPPLLVVNNSDLDIDSINAEINTLNYESLDMPFPHEMIYDNEGNPISPKEIHIRDKYINKGFRIISQSLIKEMTDKHQMEKEICPHYIYHSFILRDLKNISTDSQLNGQYFESGCLGSSTNKVVLDLPRKKPSKAQREDALKNGYEAIGDKKIDHIRIDEQIERFKIRCEELSIQIITGTNTHQTLLKKWDDKYLLAGETDIWPTVILYKRKNENESILRLCILDLKLTMDVDSTFGDFGWGKPQYLDLIQGDMYHFLIRDLDFDLNPNMKNILSKEHLRLIQNDQVLFLYWVFGYKKEPLHNQELLLERDYFDEQGTLGRQQELKERIRKTIYRLELEEQYGWQKNPIKKHCDRCSLASKNGGNCKESEIVKV